MSELTSVAKLENCSGKRVLVRCDFNVPVVNGKIESTFRVDRSLETLRFLRDNGAHVRIIAHIESSEVESLACVAEYLNTLIPTQFISDLSDESAISQAETDGKVILFENIRNHEGEKANDAEFARTLSLLGDVFVNEAFSVSHREHASVVGIPRHLETYFGFQFMSEIEFLSSVFHPEKPFLFILGGSKFETKLPLVKKFKDSADTMYLAGALAHTLYKAKGYQIGKSVYSDVVDGTPILSFENVVLPEDVVLLSDETRVGQPDEVVSDEMIVDAGPQSVECLEKLIAEAKTILWNGPLGFYEKGYDMGTDSLAKLVANSDAKTIVGGGDTLTSIFKLKLENSFTFVSTGGGAMLQYLADETLPGISAAAKGTS